MAKSSPQNNNSISRLNENITELKVAVGQLNQTVKMSLSQQKQVNENLAKDLEKHKEDTRIDVNNLWDAIKKNTTGIWQVRVILAAFGGLILIVSLAGGITKLMGLW